MQPHEDARPPPDEARDDGDRVGAAAERTQRLADLGALAGGAAHDVNNVLGVILGYVELARMGLDADPERAAVWLEKALASVDRAREVSDGLLDAVRREGLAPDASPLGPAVEAGAALLGRTLGPAVAIEVTGAAADDPCTPLDLVGLRQLVVALGLDAAAAMPEGGRIVYTIGRETRPEGRFASLRVRDPGVGPRPVESAARGVAVVQRMVERCGGSLARADGPDGGDVSVRLPCELTAPPASAAGGAALVVDADPAAREVLRERLAARGHVVLEAGTLAEARAHLAAEPIGLLCVDALLPDGAGADLAIQAAVAEVVYTSGRPDPLPALPPHARVLCKPFLEADLAAALRGDLTGGPG